jgi:hypothetical protein
MIPTPNEEPKPSSRHHWLNRPGVAVASLVACWASRAFFEPQMRWFSVIIPIFITLLLYSLVYLNTLLSSLLSIFVSFPFSDPLRAVKLICFPRSSARTFSTGWGVIQIVKKHLKRRTKLRCDRNLYVSWAYLHTACFFLSFHASLPSCLCKTVMKSSPNRYILNSIFIASSPHSHPPLLCSRRRGRL